MCESHEVQLNNLDACKTPINEAREFQKIEQDKTGPPDLGLISENET